VFEDDHQADNGDDDDKDETDMCSTARDSCKYDMEEPTLTGKVHGKFVIKVMAKVGLTIKNCVGFGTDGYSVMASKISGAVTTIQKVAPHAVRCPCYNHALNLSLGKTSSVHAI